MTSPDKLTVKYSIPVPRYTSYPPANYFNTDYKAENYRNSLLSSNSLEPSNISLYFHIPFCHSKCWYCGCNSCPMPGDEMIRDYFSALSKEIAMVASLLDKGRKVSQVHYGGGTPNSIDIKYIKEVNDQLFSSFVFIGKPEIAIECHPAYLSREYIISLKEAGFNRFSIGIQDFNEDVLASVRRKSPLLPLREIMDNMKDGNETSGINLDFIYGLPRQTEESFTKTIHTAILHNPERLTIFPYAHVPWLNRLQENLEKQGLPQPGSRAEMIGMSRQLLLDNGYLKIAMDHFALPTDELAIAANKGELHRNFQGYCTRRTTGQVYAFGVSGISQMEHSYAQNVKDVGTYIQSIREGVFPTERGYDLTPDEATIRNLINDLMCNKTINWNKLAIQHKIEVERLKFMTGFDMNRLNILRDDGLVIYTPEQIEVTEAGEDFLQTTRNYSKPF